MTWQGINRGITSVSEDMGASEYQQNTRMTVRGELQRRPGMAPANFSPQGTAALGMVGAFPTSGPYGMIVDTAGTVNGFPITMPIWGPPQLKPPRPIGTCYAASFSWGVDGTDYTFGICDGNVNIRTPFSVNVTVARYTAGGVLGFVIDSRATGALANYNVAVPFNSDYPRIGVTHVGGLGAHDLRSNAACASQWTINQAFSVAATTIYEVTPCDTVLATCAGKFTLNFTSVSSVGATATVYRSDGGGGTTNIFDSRAIVTGSSYVVNVPADAVLLKYVRVSINIGGAGLIVGSAIGAANPGCS